MLKNKKAIWIALAVVFIVVLFLSKTTSVFKNKETYQKTGEEIGLSYNTIALEELVNKDTDQDEVLDWEEGLWGTDPTKKETTPGISDKEAINKLKAEQAETTGTTKKTNSEKENLTETDQLSRELFATVASLSQSGQIDEATIEELSSQLAEKITNPVMLKVFLLSDIKIVDNGGQATENYLLGVDEVFTKGLKGKSFTEILKEFLGDGENLNTKVLTKFDPILKNLTEIINGLVKTEVPRNLAPHHLNLINTLESLKENIADIKLFTTDPIVAMGAIISYQKNIDKLDSVIGQIGNEINRSN